jgi:hypothetical protein
MRGWMSNVASLPWSFARQRCALERNQSTATPFFVDVYRGRFSIFCDFPLVMWRRQGGVRKAKLVVKCETHGNSSQSQGRLQK